MMRNNADKNSKMPTKNYSGFLAVITTIYKMESPISLAWTTVLLVKTRPKGEGLL